MMRARALHRLASLGIVAALTAWLAAGALADRKPGKAPKPPAEDQEVVLGRKNAEQNDKEVKLVTDAAMLERVNRIGQDIAAVANTVEVRAHWGTPAVKKFAYTFKIVDDKDVNAYSLPGGYIYVNKGLLDYVHSDDELAGVLAHEVAHAAHHHMIELIHQEEKIQQRTILPLLVAVILGHAGPETAQGLIMGGQLYMMAKLNTYGIEAEKDADQTAVHYLVKTKYNPVGILTFMERLAFDELRKPQVELGIYRTHPPSPERSASLYDELKGMQIAINRREVDPAIRADVTSRTANGYALADITMSKVVVASMTAIDGQTAEVRARTAATRLNTLFDQGLQTYEVRVSSDGSRVIAAQVVVLTFTQADAEAQKTTVGRLAESARDAIKNLIWQDQFNRPPGEARAGL